MTSIFGPAEILDACSCPRAIVFLLVNWAIQSIKSQSTVQELAKLLAEEQVGDPIRFFVADLSEQEGDVWTATREWLSSEAVPVDRLTFGGYGALIWLRAGKVVAHVTDAGQIGQEKLLMFTKEVLR